MNDEFQFQFQFDSPLGSHGLTKVYIDPLTAGLLGAGAGAGLSSLFGSKKKPKISIIEQYPGAAQTRATLAGAAEPGALAALTTAGQAYPGEFTAEPSIYETYGLEELGKYLASPYPTTSPLYGAAESELMKTMTGEGYDPFTSEYYEAYRTNLMRELQRAKDRLGHTAAGKDAFFGGGRLAEERLLEESALGNIAQVLGGLQEAERTRRLGAVPQALGLTQYAEQAPLGRVSAALGYGALPRTLEQTELTARYSDYIRQLQGLGLPLDVAMSLATPLGYAYQPMAQQPDIAGLAGTLAMMYAMSGGFGGGGAGGGVPSVTSPSYGYGWNY